MPRLRQQSGMHALGPGELADRQRRRGNRSGPPCPVGGGKPLAEPRRVGGGLGVVPELGVAQRPAVAVEHDEPVALAADRHGGDARQVGRELAEGGEERLPPGLRRLLAPRRGRFRVERTRLRHCRAVVEAAQHDGAGLGRGVDSGDEIAGHAGGPQRAAGRSAPAGTDRKLRWRLATAVLPAGPSRWSRCSTCVPPRFFAGRVNPNRAIRQVSIYPLI